MLKLQAGQAVAVRGVLAGAYLNRNVRDDQVTRSHVIIVDAEGWEVEEKTLCRRILTERLADMCAPHDGPPTCPECLARVARLKVA